MPRDSFYDNHAAEIAANIIMAELDPFLGTVFVAIEPFADGRVCATTRTGNQLTLEWDVATQSIHTVDEVRMPEYGVRTIVLAA